MEKEINTSGEDFNVVYMSQTKDDTVVLSSVKFLNDRNARMMAAAYDPKNDSYSTYLSDNTNTTSLTTSEINDLLTNAQNDLSKIKQIASYNRKLVNMNDIVGKTVESIDTNINSEVKFTFPSADENSSGRNKKKRLNECKSFIRKINVSIRPEYITRNAITTSYVEGNWISYLRHEDPTNYRIDIYPLGVCEISDYDVNGDPIVLVNISELRSRLSKTYKKNKKNKGLFFDKIEDEVKANYPYEVYKAFIDKENYAILDPKYTGVVRINNLNRKYGVSPICRSYLDLNMLDTFMETDRINSKARSKKIINQVMRKEAMGKDYNTQWENELIYAHHNFMQSFKQQTVVVTSPPTVEEIKYIEPSVEMTPRDTYNTYRSKVLSTLGIQFLMDSGSQSVSTASISVTQLMRTINAISEQIELVFRKLYRQILIDNNYPLEYAPMVKVIDAEQLEGSLKLELASTLFSTMNCSYTTAMEMLGLDINDEISKRKYENDNKYDEIFTPHGSQYTASSNNTGGRPTGTDTDTEAKREYDAVRNNSK